MKSKNRRLIPLVLLSLLLVLVLSFSVFGISFVPETSGQWTKFGFDRYSSNSYVYPSSIFTGELESGSNFTYTDTEVAGGNFQPIAFDWDSDGVVEIIAPVGTTLKIYNPSTNAFVEEASYSMGGTMGAQGWCGTDDTLGKYCVINVGSSLVSLSYNGATVSSLGSATFNGSLASAINCYSDDSEGYSVPYCFATRDDSGAEKLVQFRADTDNDITEVSFIGGGDDTLALGISGTSWYKPIIEDIDYDGTLEVTAVSFSTAPTPDRSYINVYEWDNATNSLSADTGFSTDGLYELGGITGNYGYIAYDLDSANDLELCHFGYASSSLIIRCLNGDDGTAYDTETLSTSASARGNALLVSDVDADSVQELVAVWNDGTNLQISVVEGSTGSLTGATDYATNIPQYSSNEPHVSSAQVNDDAYFDIIIANYVFYFNGSGMYFNESKNIVANENVVPVNFNNDAVMDFVGQKLNSLSLYTSGAGGLPTTSTITLNTDLEDSGFYNYYPTVCKDTNATYKALECVTGVFDSTCTYINTDTSSTERIVASTSTLGQINGSYDALNPEVEYNWSQTGTYNLNLYMQDTATSTYYGVAESITISVVDGTAGVDCNIPSAFISQPSDQGDTSTPASIDSAEDFFNLFSYGSSSMKFLFGLIIILGMAVMGFSMGKSVFMAVIFGVAGLILATILGLIPLWVIIGMALLMALPLLLKMAFNNG